MDRGSQDNRPRLGIDRLEHHQPLDGHGPAFHLQAAQFAQKPSLLVAPHEDHQRLAYEPSKGKVQEPLRRRVRFRDDPERRRDEIAESFRLARGISAKMADSCGSITGSLR
jgi:hypothetical protein